MTARRRAARAIAALGVLLTAAVAAPFAGAPAGRAAELSQPDRMPVYTLLGRGYAVMFGYPLDEVPHVGEEEEAGPAPSPPPDQTCPEETRGIDEVTQERIDRLTDVSGLEPTQPRSTNAVPVPRGQPIKFDFGLADTSLRSDPGAHSIAAFFYVDLGGSQHDRTSVETDSHATGHAREQERCGRPFSSAEGTADDVHVISKASAEPYSFAFNQTRRSRFGPVATAQHSLTVAEMDGRSGRATARIASLVEGVVAGPLTVDAVSSVVHYETDGTEQGTELRTLVRATNVRFAGQEIELVPGAPPIAVEGLLIGLAAPEVRVLADGTLDVEAGGLFVGAEAPNPLGLQAKQAVFFGGAQLQANSTTITSLPPLPEPTEQPPPDPGTGPLPQTPPLDPVGTAEPVLPTEPVASPRASDPLAPVAAPIRRIGVYRRTTFPTGPAVIVGLVALGLLAGLYGWARRRSPRAARLLQRPPLSWLDYGYRAFVRG